MTSTDTPGREHPARSPWAIPGRLSGELVARPTYSAGMTDAHREEVVSAVVDLVATAYNPNPPAYGPGWDVALASAVVRAQGMRRRGIYAALYAANYKGGRGDVVEQACDELANLVSDPEPFTGTDDHAGEPCVFDCWVCAGILRGRVEYALDRLLDLLGTNLALDVHTALADADAHDRTLAELTAAAEGTTTLRLVP